MEQFTPIKEGKVREVYDIGDSLIIVATDRISAFDVILKNKITNKGAILTQMSRFWFDFTKDIVPNHMISVDVKTTDFVPNSEYINVKVDATVKIRVGREDELMQLAMANFLNAKEEQIVGKVQQVAFPGDEGDSLKSGVFQDLLDGVFVSIAVQADGEHRHIVRQGLFKVRDFRHLRDAGRAGEGPEVEDRHVLGGNVLLGEGPPVQGARRERGQASQGGGALLACGLVRNRLVFRG